MTPEQKEQRRQAAARDTAAVISGLSEPIRAAAYVVGAWVWVKFEDKPAPEIREELKSAGFHWNRERGVWQHSGGVFRPHAPYDPRMKYQTFSLDDAVKIYSRG
jgi:hypothetical protein